MDTSGSSDDWTGAGGIDDHVMLFDDHGLPLPYQYMQSYENISGYGAKQSLPIQTHGVDALSQPDGPSLPKTTLHQHQSLQLQQAPLPLSSTYFPELDAAGPLGDEFLCINPEQLSLLQTFRQRPSMTSSMTSSSSVNDMPDLTSASTTSRSSHNYSNAISSHRYLQPSKHQPHKVLSSRSRSSFSDTPIKQRKFNARKTGSGKIQLKKAMAQFESALKPFYPKLSKGFQQHSVMLFAQFKLLMEKEAADGNLDAEFDSMSLATSSTHGTSASSYTMDSISPTDAGSSISSTPRPYRRDTEDMTETGAEPDERIRYYCTFPNCSVLRKDCKCRAKTCKCQRKRERYWSQSKVDLRRHEEGEKHWPQDIFMCLECPSMVEDLNEDPMCAFCSVPFSLLGEPKIHYLECELARQNGKTFGRKDHLCGHLREQHGMEDMGERTKSWKFPIDSDWPRQCGFCGSFFDTWDQRMKHIGLHFDKGFKIKDWKLPFLGPKDKKPPGSSASYRKDEDDDDDNDNFGGGGDNSQGKMFGQGLSGNAAQAGQGGDAYTPQDHGSFLEDYHYEGHEMRTSGPFLNDGYHMKESIMVFSPKRDRWSELTAQLDTGSTDNWISAAVVKRMGLVPSVIPTMSFQTPAGDIIASSRILRGMIWSTVGMTEKYIADFLVFPRNAPFDVLLGEKIARQRIEEYFVLKRYSIFQRDPTRETTPPQILRRSSKLSLALERYLVNSEDRVPALSATPLTTAGELKYPRPHILSFGTDRLEQLNQRSGRQTVLQSMWGGGKTENNKTTLPNEQRAQLGGYYNIQLTKDSIIQFGSSLRVKRLNELQRLLFTSLLDTPQFPRYRRSTPSISRSFRTHTASSSAPLRNSSKIRSRTAEMASQLLRDLFISLLVTPVKDLDCLDELFCVRSKTHSDVKNSFWDRALWVIFQHHQASRMRPEFFQRWWQNRQRICFGLSHPLFQSTGSRDIFRHTVDLCLGLQFLHSEISEEMAIHMDDYPCMIDYKPTSIVVSSDMEIQGAFPVQVLRNGRKYYAFYRWADEPDSITKNLAEKNDQPQRTYQIYGIGGVGKIKIALQFAYVNPCDFDDLFWIQSCAITSRCGDPANDDGKFVRSPDITERLKNRFRLWKCSFETCKYHEVGWPTEKERDRHYIDIHAGHYQFSTLDGPAYDQRLDKYGRAISTTSCLNESRQEEQERNFKQGLLEQHGRKQIRSNHGNAPQYLPSAVVERTPLLRYTPPSPPSSPGSMLPLPSISEQTYPIWEPVLSHHPTSPPGVRPFELPVRQQITYTRVADITPRNLLDEETCRKRLTSYEVYTLRKIAPRNSKERSTWAKSEITKDVLSQEAIMKSIKALNEGKQSVRDKKMALFPSQQGQINRLLDELMATESDSNFEWSLVQLDSKGYPVERVTTRNSSHFQETSTFILYLERAPFEDINPIFLFNCRERIKVERLERENRPPPQPYPGQRIGGQEFLRLCQSQSQGISNSAGAVANGEQNTVVEDTASMNPNDSAHQRQQGLKTIMDAGKPRSLANIQGRCSADASVSDPCCSGFSSDDSQSNPYKLNTSMYSQRLDKYGRAISAAPQDKHIFVISVDFGTSTTSAYWRPVKACSQSPYLSSHHDCYPPPTPRRLSVCDDSSSSSLSGINSESSEKGRCTYPQCGYVKYSKSQGPLMNKDPFRDHFREYHKEDLGAIGKKPLETKKWKELQGAGLAERWIRQKSWRCSRCLCRVLIAKSGYECSTCSYLCEERLMMLIEGVRQKPSDLHHSEGDPDILPPRRELLRRSKRTGPSLVPDSGCKRRKLNGYDDETFLY